jgi:predicted N-acyltransferase
MRMTIASGLADVSPDDWDALALGRSPFLRHGFLRAMETSGSVGPGTGWQPLPILVHDGDELVGALPAYVKSHSYGEYIFDWGWAEGAQRAGLSYYPKLVVAVPFTPATGRRILLKGGRRDVAAPMLHAVRDVAGELGLSSVHFLFTEEEDQELLVEAGFQPRLTMQYHWRNLGDWGSWEEFLGALRSKRRREIRRERKLVREAGIDVRVEHGAALGDAEWAAMWAFYRDTTSRKWGQAYLTRAFFEELRRNFADRVRLVVARKDGQIVASALNFLGEGAMYGRYWGCLEQHKQLHFETCYYAAVQYCLEHGIPLYEAGAQGEHKISRGFLPRGMRSAHWIRHPGLGEAIADFLADEREHNAHVIEALAARKSPFSALPEASTP